MTHTEHQPAVYQLRVAGRLDQHWSAWFGGLTLTHEDDGSTSLTGAVTDQAELHGLLTKIRDLVGSTHWLTVLALCLTPYAIALTAT